MNQTRIITGLVIAFSLLLGVLYLPHSIILYIASCIVGVSLWEHLRLRFHIFISTSISLLVLLSLLVIPLNLLPLKTIIFVGLVLLFVPSLTASELDSGDTAWILTATALVLFMTLPGLALFYGGLVRSKNVLSVLMQCFTIACLMSVCWVVYGYSLAFKGDGSFFGDFSALFLSGVGRDSLSGTLPESLFITFQMTFAIITPALVVGAFAERMRFSAMCLFSIAWFTLVYVPACHMVWGGGYLGSIGVIDFAGGLVVHATCGLGALVAAVYLGPRKGFNKIALPPHNRTMVMIGASMLWVGWFGFNAGSAVAADGSAGMAMLVTHISASVAALTWMGIEWIKSGKATMIGIATGMVAGLATITPASGTVGPGGALMGSWVLEHRVYLMMVLWHNF